MAITLPMLDTQFLIPFLFMLAIVFGALRVSGLFKGNPGVNLLISFVLALFSATYAPFTTFLWTYLPDITWFFIAMFFLLFILEIFGIRRPGKKSEYMTDMIIYAILLLILFSVGFLILQTYPISIPFIGGGENAILLVGVILILGIFWAAYKTPAQAKGG